MAVYIRRFGSRSYFMGFKNPFIPTLGLPDHALPFESRQSAFDCLPAVLHHDMEVVGEDCRRPDAEAWRLQTPQSNRTSASISEKVSGVRQAAA